MTSTDRGLTFSGKIDARVIRAKGPGLAWKVQNNFNWPYLRSWIGVMLIVPLAKAFGIATMYGELRALLIKGDTGERINYGVVSRRVVTTAGVTYMRDDFNNNAGSADITLFNYHGCGVGTGNEDVSDTALGTESTTALNPDSTRATGTRSTPAANQFRTIGTLTFDADAAVTEHGIFTQAATGGGTLWDRSKFAAINVVGANGDSIQFTYTLTLTAGG